jgi:hypothetical protein
MDETSTFIHPLDNIPFLQEFDHLGTPLGLHLNVAKTKFLTTINEISIHQQLWTPHITTLIYALDYIQQQDPANPDPELTNGACFLSQPISSKKFANKYLAKAAAIYATTNHDTLCSSQPY